MAAAMILERVADKLPLRQSLEGWHIGGNVVEGLLVNRVNRQFRLKLTRVVKRSDLYHYQWMIGSRYHVRPAFRAKLSRHGLFEVAPGKLLRRSLGVFETIRSHRKKHVGRPTSDVLALAAMALRLHEGIALGHIAYCTTITSAF
jgi:hypothetical protein